MEVAEGTLNTLLKSDPHVAEKIENTASFQQSDLPSGHFNQILNDLIE